MSQPNSAWLAWQHLLCTPHPGYHGWSVLSKRPVLSTAHSGRALGGAFRGPGGSLSSIWGSLVLPGAPSGASLSSLGGLGSLGGSLVLPQGSLGGLPLLMLLRLKRGRYLGERDLVRLISVAVFKGVGLAQVSNFGGNPRRILTLTRFYRCASHIMSLSPE